MMIVTGILAAFIVNAILASSGDWRLMLGLAAVPSLVLLVGMLRMPETPRYLVKEGEHEEAHEVLEEVTEDEVARVRSRRSRRSVRSRRRSPSMASGAFSRSAGCAPP